jgi:hypothetical protein
MAIRLVEQDFGTKAATAKVLRKMYHEHPDFFDLALWQWWRQVYLDAIKFVPVDTGALRRSIRIQRGAQGSGPYNVGAGVTTVNKQELDEVVREFYILAGGFGVINPKHNREVDYAQAVHDGYQTSRGWRPGRPFLTRALNKHIGTLASDMEKYLQWYEDNWEETEPIPNPQVFHLDTKIKTFINGVWKYA